VPPNQHITPANDPEYQPATFYYTDAITDNAVRYLQQHQRNRRGNPSSCIWPATAAHWPMHALEKDIAKYRGKYDEGYAPVRQARLQRLRELGLLPAGWQPAPLSAIDA
jgi:arylsulfatase